MVTRGHVVGERLCAGRVVGRGVARTLVRAICNGRTTGTSRVVVIREGNVDVAEYAKVVALLGIVDVCECYRGCNGNMEVHPSDRRALTYALVV